MKYTDFCNSFLPKLITTLASVSIYNQAFQDNVNGQLKTNLDELNFLIGLTF
jgi:hypothetical protein